MNNRAERAIKPFVIGRNYVLYSIIETAKANDLNVFEYMMTRLDELSKPNVDVEQLLPWQFVKR